MSRYGRVYLIQGYHKVKIPDGVRERVLSGKVELWNGPRPFNAHETFKGDFLRGVFYGVIDPDGEFADSMRDAAEKLDIDRVLLISVDEVLEDMQAYYDLEYPKIRIDVREHKFTDVAHTWLRVCGYVGDTRW